MVIKTAASVQMNYTVPDSEKEIAEKAEEYLEQLLAEFQSFTLYLNLIHIPFKKYSNVDMSMIAEYRQTFRQYRDQVKVKFNKIKKIIYQILTLLNVFSTDTATSEVIDSFAGSIKDLDKYVDTFINIFNSFNNPDFPKYIIATIDSIIKQINQIEQLVNDRILEHIDTNILAKNWIKDFTTDEDKPIEDRVPLVIQLFQERKELLKDK
jgi:hypothetical protein